MENELINWITTELKARGWSQRKLARRSELSHTHISNVLSGKRPITFDFCAAVADPLDRTPEELFRLAGLLPPLPNPDEDRTLSALWKVVTNMTEDDRQEVFNYARYRLQLEEAKKRRAEATASSEGTA